MYLWRYDSIADHMLHYTCPSLREYFFAKKQLICTRTVVTVLRNGIGSLFWCLP